MNLRPVVRPVLVALAVLAAGAILAAFLAKPLAVSGARAIAHGRGLELSWSRFDLRWPARAEVLDLAVFRPGREDTLLRARRAEASMRPLPLLLMRTEADFVSLDGVWLRLPPPSEAELDTLAPGDENAGGEVAASVRQRAEAFVRTLLAPARRLPRLRVSNVEVTRGDEPLLTLEALSLDREGAATHLAITGLFHGEDEVPFDILLAWQADDRLTGRAQCDIPDPGNSKAKPLVLTFDGRVSQDPKSREVRVAEGSTLRVGDAVAHVQGLAAAAGPRFHVEAAFDGLDRKTVVASVPRVMLGPLTGLEVSGRWDWHADFDLDLAKPDSLRFHADVVPHGLSLDPALSRPSPAAIAGPFTAQIQLPRGRVVTREISPLNPYFRPLTRISPYLRDAVVTNEDGGFWKHRGFNTEAIGLAVGANLRAGSFKRGAGTITMQLARNLWLGHRRTLARKAQEVVMAWVVEHLSGVSKERMLEVYLNIIEWGPEVHGAEEAARYYFATDAEKLSLEESLFLAIVVPSPSKWRWRFKPDGTLRPYARAQMRFIAGKMAAKGWLDPEQVPVADSIQVTLRGPARDLFVAPDTAAAVAAR
jgi:hypothetical protein